LVLKVKQEFKMGDEVAGGARQQGTTQRGNIKAQQDEFQETQKLSTMETQETQTAQLAATTQDKLKVQ
jgi:hypothetical protein